MVKVLFVCTGNICRSPTAEVVFRARVADAGLAATIETDSAGLAAYHLGEPPDPRTQEAAARRGHAMADLRARQVKPADFKTFEWIVALDRSHLHGLRRVAPPGTQGQLYLLRDFSQKYPVGGDVPDPYYGGPADFEQVLDLVEDACDGLLAAVRATI
ncbi:low molecular weight protein-tyrosine-phosphatase [Pararhodospirillum oryzae]|uniref:protein-tyrosine-phosphatase n=1 Tax=Pararhodospirillum oryzae TaxID=478448 RepID=A0A512HBK5_9PROT|nr:low molecular weight protein-tyrosine-phosphatase [Pararhodospirillum oryzae]GEO82834.1 phosphotyrosine protein phosphatase [Pararhodospirillum oryzae]